MSKKIKQNIPTENKGELRSLDEYIVAPGSFVPVSQKDIDDLPEKEKPLAGFYTVEKAVPPATLFYEDLPQCFKDVAEKRKSFQQTKTNKNVFKKGNGKTSALFGLQMSDIVTNHSPRFPHPLHSSETGSNFSLSDDNKTANCWRHLVSMGAIQFLAIKSGKFDCSEIGTPHKGSSRTLDNKVIFWAWHQAKKDGLISENDPIPLKALCWIAKTHNLINSDLCKPGKLPVKAFNQALEIVEADY